MTSQMNVPKLIGMGKVTPHSMAYIAMQVSQSYDLFANESLYQLRFSLSNVSSGWLIDIYFDCIAFYSAIVKYFECASGPRPQTKANKLIDGETSECYIIHQLLALTLAETDICQSCWSVS